MIIPFKFVQLIFFISFCFSQVNIQFYQESKIAIGETIAYGDTSSYIINENIFDLGLSYNSFYLYTQLEYSEDPFLGEPKIYSEDMINSYYLEYLGDRLNLKIGNIYSQYTRGLILNTYQDQGADFDNSITGLELDYNVTDWLRFYSIYGTDTYEFRAHPINQVNDFSHDHNLVFLGLEYRESEWTIIDDFILNIQYMHQELTIDDSINITDISDYKNSIDFYGAQETILGDYISNNYFNLENSWGCSNSNYSNEGDCESNGYCSNESIEYQGQCQFTSSCSIPDYISSEDCEINEGVWTPNVWTSYEWTPPSDGFESDNISKYKITSDMLGLSAEGYILGFDLYTEYVASKYTKLTPSVESGELIDGSMFYGSISRDIFDLGITYEFKRYDMPYFIRTVSFAPFVYREATSVLQSRLSHSMNFSNEIGHQLDLLYPIGDSFMLNLNVSTARRINPLKGGMHDYFVTHDFDDEFLNQNLNAGFVNIDDFMIGINDYWESEETSTNTTYYEYSETPDIMSIVFMDKDESVYAFWPYRQLYAGINGYLFDDRLYFNLGLDLFEHIKSWGNNASGSIYEPGMIRNYYDNTWQQDSTVLSQNIMEYIDIYWDNIEIAYTTYMLSLDSFVEDGTYTLEEADSIALESLDYPNMDNINDINSLMGEYKQAAIDSLDNYRSIYSNYYKWKFENEKAITIPTQFSWNLGGGSSVLLYLEKQWRTIEKNADKSYSSGPVNSSGTSRNKFDELYISLSFKNKNNTITFYRNHEKESTIGYNMFGDETSFDTEDSWNGVEWAVSFKSRSQDKNDIIHNSLLSNSRFSIFYGSQKGGLVCANGICATQPEFLNGLKLSFTRTF